MSMSGGLRLWEPQRLVDLELLPSVQGLVWRVLADGVRAKVENGRLMITRPGGLRLSAADAPPLEPAGAKAGAPAQPDVTRAALPRLGSAPTVRSASAR